jgi:O-methyltransferase involved in polyketide biosynthesis
MIAYKEEMLSGIPLTCRLDRIACDLTNDQARYDLFSRLGAASSKSLAITEGLIGCLKNEDAGKLSRDIFRIPSVQFWIMDYSQGRFRNHRRAKDLKKVLAHAPFRFTVKDPVRFFEENGWKVKSNIYILDEAKRIGRGLPLMFPWNLLIRLQGRRLREMAYKTYGRKA